MYAQKNAKRGMCTLSTLPQFELLSVLGGPGAPAVKDCCRGRHGGRRRRSRRRRRRRGGEEEEEGLFKANAVN